MIKVCCCNPECQKELTEPGALVFGPPDAEGNTKKYHVCTDCFIPLENWLTSDDYVIARWSELDGG